MFGKKVSRHTFCRTVEKSYTLFLYHVLQEKELDVHVFCPFQEPWMLRYPYGTLIVEMKDNWSRQVEFHLLREFKEVQLKLDNCLFNSVKLVPI
jgi:hypothetical protein